MTDDLQPQTPATREKPPAICQICGKELPFLGYGSKIGKDGREAKWPMYEKCDKSQHSSFKKAAASDYIRLESTPVIEDEIRIVLGRSGPKGMLWQLDEWTGRALEFAIGEFTTKYGVPPASLHMHPTDIAITIAQLGADHESLKAKMVPDTKLTPGFRYVLLVSKEGEAK